MTEPKTMSMSEQFRALKETVKAAAPAPKPPAPAPPKIEPKPLPPVPAPSVPAVPTHKVIFQSIPKRCGVTVKGVRAVCPAVFYCTGEEVALFEKEGFESQTIEILEQTLIRVKLRPLEVIAVPPEAVLPEAKPEPLVAPAEIPVEPKKRKGKK